MKKETSILRRISLPIKDSLGSIGVDVPIKDRLRFIGADFKRQTTGRRMLTLIALVSSPAILSAGYFLCDWWHVGLPDWFVLGAIAYISFYFSVLLVPLALFLALLNSLLPWVGRRQKVVGWIVAGVATRCMFIIAHWLNAAISGHDYGLPWYKLLFW